MSDPQIAPVAPPYYPPPPPPPRGGGCMGIVVVLLVLGLGFSVFLNLALLGAKGSSGSSIGGSPKPPSPMAQKWVQGEGEKKVLLLEVNGVIMDEVATGGLFGSKVKLVERIQRELDEAAKDDEVRAVLLDVDSPGGGVTASDQIWKAITDFKTKSRKPVVVHMGALCASGGYYISSPADWIVCDPTTITGSIGVIMSTVNLSGLVQKFDVKPVTIKSGANKDLLNTLEPINPAHIEILQRTVDEMYDLFVKRVQDGRGSRIKVPDLKAICDGSVYSAQTALKYGLVDQEGYQADAFEKCKELSKESKMTLFRYTRTPSFLDALSGDVETSMPDLARAGAHGGLTVSIEGLLSAETPRAMYLWKP